MINLRSNYPSLRQESILFEEYLSRQVPAERLLAQPLPVTPEVYLPLLEAYLQVPSSLLLGTSNLVDCNSGTQALFTLLFALRKDNPLLGIEDFTYSGLKTTAGHLQYQLYTVEGDEEGLLPEAVNEAIEKGVRLFYVQPTIHNPTCRVMSETRRKQLVAILKGTGAVLMEDDAYRFLHPHPPSSFLRLLPEQTIHTVSLAKPFNSFIQTCFVIYPQQLLAGFPGLLDKAGGARSALYNGFAKYLLEGTHLLPLVKAKQENARLIQSRLKPLLDGLPYQTQPTSYHIWIALPPGQDSVTMVEKLTQKGIAVTGSHECSATGNSGFIRIALSAEKDMTVLQYAMQEIRQLVQMGA